MRTSLTFLGTLFGGRTFHRTSRIFRALAATSSIWTRRTLTACSLFVILWGALFMLILAIAAANIIGRLGVRFSRSISRSPSIFQSSGMTGAWSSLPQDGQGSCHSASTGPSSIVIDGRRRDSGQLRTGDNHGITY